MNYSELLVVAEMAGEASRLPIKLTRIYLNCTRWEIRFSEEGAEGRQFTAVIDIHDDFDEEAVKREIKRQLLAEAA